MQKPFIYTRFFRSLKTYDHRFWGKFENNLVNFISFQNQNPIEFTDFDEREWHWPNNNFPREDLYNIIILIAKILKVKIMWKREISFFGNDHEIRKSLLIIGERNRTIICCHLLVYVIDGILRFEDFIKKNEWELAKTKGFPSRIKYAKTLTKVHVWRILSLFALSQIEDKVYKVRLENYIMGQYKLDYKNYGQEQNAYWNAVSKTFYPKRMML
jgi:hypothetical protein